MGIIDKYSAKVIVTDLNSFNNSNTVFDYEDLAEDIMIVLCVRANPND